MKAIEQEELFAKAKGQSGGTASSNLKRESQVEITMIVKGSPIVYFHNRGYNTSFYH